MSDNEWKITGPDGKEYELVPPSEVEQVHCIAIKPQSFSVLVIRTKRKQTGWKCEPKHSCIYVCSQKMSAEFMGDGPGNPPSGCTHDCDHWANWVPDYREAEEDD